MYIRSWLPGAFFAVLVAACAAPESDEADFDASAEGDGADAGDAADAPSETSDSSAFFDEGLDEADDVTDDSADDSADGRDSGTDERADLDVDAADPDADTIDGESSEVDADAAADADISEPAVLAELLDALGADPAAAVGLQQAGTGWPAAVAGGWLFVSLDPALTSLAGDFNEWTPEPMNDGGDFRWIVRSAANGDGYKFTDGSRWAADPWARSYLYDGFGELSTVHSTQARLERHVVEGDDVIGGRELRVWIPGASISHLLYAHDGQNLFDPDAFHGGWRLQDSAPVSMMIVGIDNSSARFEEYTAFVDRVGGDERGGAAADYLAWIEETVRPLVREQYGEPARVGMMGSSLGGLLVLYAHAAGIGDFDFVAALSPSVSWGSRMSDGDTILSYFAEVGAQPGAVYVDSGGGGESCVDTNSDGVRDDDPTEADGYCTTLQLAELLDSLGYEYLSTLWHWWEPGALHNEAAWASRVERPLLLFAEL
jgi:hypothetical protein